MTLREFELGAIQAHILHHAAAGPIYGTWLVEELARHGYTVSYGTLYPTLHRLQEAGWLVVEEQQIGSTRRKYYRATPAGRAVLAETRRMVRELYHELIEEAEETHDSSFSQK